MNAERFAETVKVMHDEAASIVTKKRPDYTQESADVLANFKDAARDAGITPMQAWLVHFQKQYSAVARHVKNPAGAPSETMLSRFCDLRNYLDLGYALMKETDLVIPPETIKDLWTSYPTPVTATFMKDHGKDGNRIKGSPEYEKFRTEYFNTRNQPKFEISTPFFTSPDVQDTVAPAPKVILCKNCAKIIFYSGPDTVYLHNNGKYYCAGLDTYAEPA